MKHLSRNALHHNGGHKGQFVVERRDDLGKLNFTGEQPPWLYATSDQLVDYYFKHSGDTNNNADPQVIAAWFKREKSWTWREKTW